jgi:hypothetical protein
LGGEYTLDEKEIAPVKKWRPPKTVNVKKFLPDIEGIDFKGRRENL